MTLGFSNTPGMVKPFWYKNEKTGVRVCNLYSCGYFLLAGSVGFNLCALSQNGTHL